MLLVFRCTYQTLAEIREGAYACICMCACMRGMCFCRGKPLCGSVQPTGQHAANRGVACAGCSQQDFQWTRTSQSRRAWVGSPACRAACMLAQGPELPAHTRQPTSCVPGCYPWGTYTCTPAPLCPHSRIRGVRQGLSFAKWIGLREGEGGGACVCVCEMNTNVPQV